MAGTAEFSEGDDSIALARYNPDGSLDLTFNGTGRVITTLDPDFTASFGQEVALQSDGKILVAGSMFDGAIDAFAVVRYNADGSLDDNFGTGGFVSTNFGLGVSASANSLAVPTDGKIVVVGEAFGISFESFALARYNTDGSLF